MAVKKIPVPFCDVCGEPWLPKHRAADGTVNPLFEKPENSKRCGKCKSTRWNAAGVDRRRKKPVQDSPEEIISAFDGPVAQELVPSMQERLDSSVTILEQYLEREEALKRSVNARCKHMLYDCPECHHREVA